MTGSVQSLPRQVTVENGQVVVTGTDGSSLKMTPDAALITSARIAQCADLARREWLDEHHEDWDRPPRP